MGDANQHHGAARSGTDSEIYNLHVTTAKSASGEQRGMDYRLEGKTEERMQDGREGIIDTGEMLIDP